MGGQTTGWMESRGRWGNGEDRIGHDFGVVLGKRLEGLAGLSID